MRVVAPLLGLVAIVAGLFFALGSGSDEPRTNEGATAPTVSDAGGESEDPARTRAPEPDRTSVDTAPTEVPEQAESDPEEVEAAPVPEPAERSVSGRVVLADGAPLVGVEVGLAQSLSTTTTDAEGAFRLERVPDGAHRLRVFAGFEVPLAADVACEPGDEGIEIEVRAALVRASATRAGRSVGLRELSAVRVRADGSFDTLGLSAVENPPAPSIDLVVPAGESLLLHGDDGSGVLACYLETPVLGGRFTALVRDDAPGLATLRVVPSAVPPALQDGRVRVQLRDRATSQSIVAGLPLDQASIWSGLIPGTYDATVAIEGEASPADADASLALELPVGEVRLEGDSETTLAVDVVPGGWIELLLPELFQGGPVGPGPESPCLVEVRSPEGGPALPLTWVDETRGTLAQWRSAVALPAGSWTVEVKTQHVVLWRGSATVIAGRPNRVDAR